MFFPRILIRRFIVLCISAILLITAFNQLLGSQDAFPPPTGTSSPEIVGPVDWKRIPLQHPVTSMIPLPTGTPSALPRIQHEFGVETEHSKAKRLERAAAVKEAFLHAWNGYKQHAWLQDEVTPVTGSYRNSFGGRGATLIDSLDTLLIMGLDEEFHAALKAVKKIDFSTSMEKRVNVFETTIRYLGGLLGAYDVGGGKHHVLLEKATQLGEMLYRAFDTPSGLPVSRWNWAQYVDYRACNYFWVANDECFSTALGGKQERPSHFLAAELGSLSLEFTRLSQLTKDPKYFDAVQRITDIFDKSGDAMSVPGLFPTDIKIRRGSVSVSSGTTFTFGSMSDSLYEYFMKEHMILGGVVDQYQRLYLGAIEAAKKVLFFRPLVPRDKNILFSGTVSATSHRQRKLVPEGQHLTCFVGGMVGIGAKVFERPEELDIARKLVDGCIWAYNSTATGIMPEVFNLAPCADAADCNWDKVRWHEAVHEENNYKGDMSGAQIAEDGRFPPGYTSITDRRYLLR